MKLDLDLIKTLAAATVGTGNMLLDIDVAIKVLISLVSLVYVCKKTFDLFNNKK